MPIGVEITDEDKLYDAMVENGAITAKDIYANYNKQRDEGIVTVTFDDRRRNQNANEDEEN